MVPPRVIYAQKETTAVALEGWTIPFKHEKTDVPLEPCADGGRLCQVE
jgi:hypothetical protein